MPALIPTIDEVAEREQRCVLLISFLDIGIPYENNTARLDVIKWLDDVGIGYEECGDDPNISGKLSYKGELFVDVPCDRDDFQFRKFQEFLAAPATAPRYRHVVLSFHRPQLVRRTEGYHSA